MTARDLHVGDEIGNTKILYLCAYVNKEQGKSILFVCMTKNKTFKVYCSDGKGALYYIHKDTSLKAAIIYCWKKVKKELNLSIENNQF